MKKVIKKSIFAIILLAFLSFTNSIESGRVNIWDCIVSSATVANTEGSLYGYTDSEVDEVFNNLLDACIENNNINSGPEGWGYY